MCVSVCVCVSPSHNRLLGCLERLATMRRTDVENPRLSRQGPPSSLLLLSFTETQGWRDGVTEPTSWITSNTHVRVGSQTPPPPARRTLPHYSLLLVPYFHMDTWTNTTTSSSGSSSGKLFFPCSLLSRGVTTFCAFSFRRSRPSLKCSNAVCF